MLFVFSFSILFLFKKIILIINTLFISKSFFIKDVLGINKLKFFFDMIGDMLSLISFLIYSELIELNFLGLNRPNIDEPKYPIEDNSSEISDYDDEDIKFIPKDQI